VVVVVGSRSYVGQRCSVFGDSRHFSSRIEEQQMKIEITPEVIVELIALFGKDGAIKELQATVNVAILEAVDEAIEETK
jgi:hypothetical protein